MTPMNTPMRDVAISSDPSVPVMVFSVEQEEAPELSPEVSPVPVVSPQVQPVPGAFGMIKRPVAQKVEELERRMEEMMKELHQSINNLEINMSEKIDNIFDRVQTLEDSLYEVTQSLPVSTHETKRRAATFRTSVSGNWRMLSSDNVDNYLKVHQNHQGQCRGATYDQCLRESNVFIQFTGNMMAVYFTLTLPGMMHESSQNITGKTYEQQRTISCELIPIDDQKVALEVVHLNMGGEEYARYHYSVDDEQQLRIEMSRFGCRCTRVFEKMIPAPNTQ